MKKVFTFLLSMCLVICMSTTSYADSLVYVLSDLNMTIDLPDHFEVFTENLELDEARIREYGDVGEMVLNADSAGVSLDAFDEDSSLEIVVNSVDSKLGDYNQFSDTTLLGLASAMDSVMESLGGKITSRSIFQGAQAKFIRYVNVLKSDFGVDGLDHMIQYNTVYADKTINITLHSFNGEISDKQADEFEQVVKSVRFLSNPAPKPEVESSPSFVYVDKDTGLSFTVPENWKEAPLSQERQYLDVKFVSTEEQGLSILYGSSDSWAELSESERQGYTRSDFNNNMISDADIAAVFGGSGAVVQRVVYGNAEYFQVVMKQSANVYGVDVSATMTVLSRLENGIMYQFQFPATEDSPYFEDFVSLVSSAVYP